MRKLDDAKKRKKFPLWLSEGERLLLEAKAEEYQYKYLADYIRDAAIYESLIKVNLEGSEDLISCYQKYISEVKKYTKININETPEIKPTKNPIVLEIYNRNMEKYIDYIDFIENTLTERLDTQIAYNEIQKIRTKYYGSSNNQVNINNQ